MGLDWDKPLEAIDSDGRIQAVEFTGQKDGRDFYIKSIEPTYDDWLDGYHRPDGTSILSSESWTLRNRPTTIRTAAEHLERMEAFVRKAATWNVVGAEEARAIVAELPPVVDDDVVWARGLVASVLDGIASPDTCHGLRRGRMDNDDRVVLIAASIRRAREEGVKS